MVLDEDLIRVGPLVISGLTPCLTCLDLHRTDWDPAWPVLLSQLGRRAGAAVSPTVSAPLRHVVAAEVGAEVLALAGGARPRTVGNVVALGRATTCARPGRSGSTTPPPVPCFRPPDHLALCSGTKTHPARTLRSGDVLRRGFSVQIASTRRLLKRR